MALLCLYLVTVLCCTRVKLVCLVRSIWPPKPFKTYNLGRIEKLIFELQFFALRAVFEERVGIMTLRDCSVSVTSQVLVAWCLIKLRESFSLKLVLIFIFPSSFIIVYLFPFLLAVCLFSHAFAFHLSSSFCCHYSRFHQSFVGVLLNTPIMFRFAPYFTTAVAKHSYYSGASLRTVRWWITAFSKPG
jgi:hypothetical protein